MKSVRLFSIERDGFHKTITASMHDDAVVLSSHAFDAEGYDREYDIVVEASDVVDLADALELRRGSGRQILKELRQRFGSLAGDAKFERFLKDEGIPSTSSGSTSRA